MTWFLGNLYPAQNTEFRKQESMPSTSFSVDFLIVTRDGLRKIDFRLSKVSTNGGVAWIIEFGLNERRKTSDSFIQIIKLTINVKSADNPKAEATAKDGLDKTQAAAALAAADSAKLLSKGLISKAEAEAEAGRVITVRKF